MLIWSVYYAIIAITLTSGAIGESIRVKQHNFRRLSPLSYSKNSDQSDYNFADAVVNPLLYYTESKSAIFAKAVYNGNINNADISINSVPSRSIATKPPTAIHTIHEQRPAAITQSTTTTTTTTTTQGNQTSGTGQIKLIALGAAIVLPAVLLVGVMGFGGQQRRPVISIGNENMAPIIELDDDNDEDEPDEDPGIFSEDEEAFNSKFEIGNDASLWSPPAGLSAW